MSTTTLTKPLKIIQLNVMQLNFSRNESLTLVGHLVLPVCRFLVIHRHRLMVQQHKPLMSYEDLSVPLSQKTVDMDPVSTHAAFHTQLMCPSIALQTISTSTTRPYAVTHPPRSHNRKLQDGYELTEKLAEFLAEFDGDLVTREEFLAGCHRRPYIVPMLQGRRLASLKRIRSMSAGSDNGLGSPTSMAAMLMAANSNSSVSSGH